MHDDYNALIKNNTWTLVPQPPDVNVVRCMWLFRHKYLADGMLSRYKDRLVANGSPQLEGVDVDETFSPVVKPGRIRTVLSLAASRHWPIHQLDVKNEFFHRNLFEAVYMYQPLGFRDYTHPDYALLQRIIQSLHQEFAMTNLGSLNYFLGISVIRDSSGIFLSQKKYDVEILERAGMINCNPSRTLVDTESKLGDTGDVVCLHMHDPREPHFSALKRILHYVCGTLDYGLKLFSSSTTDLVAYSDADLAGCPTTRRSTLGYCVFLVNNLLSWSSKRQLTLSCSSAEIEYRGVANAVAETCWLSNLLRELHTPLSSATFVYCDNVSAVYLSCNPVQHQRTKHIEIYIHFVRDLVAAGPVWYNVTLSAGDALSKIDASIHGMASSFEPAYVLKIIIVYQLIMEYLVNISKKAHILELKTKTFEDYYSDIQYAVSIKEDMTYLCMHFTKDHKGTRSNTMDNPNITMEEYIRLEEEKAHRHGKVYNWKTAKYAIVYNDALTSKLDFLTDPNLSPQPIDEFDLKDETSLSEYNEVEQNVLYFNDLFPFNIIYPDNLKSDKDNDDNEIDII
ncbi:ribonuclease H-like domain-containing protein [Tanacetum coccineum]